MDVDDELVTAFLEESTENLDQLDLDLVELEQRPTDPELLARVFRTIHTIKGTCGFLAFGSLEELAHAGEDLLAALRAGDLVLDEPITSALLALVDQIRGVLAVVAETGTEGNADHAPVIAELRRQLARKDGPTTAEPSAPADTAAQPEPPQSAPEPPGQPGHPPDAPAAEESSVRIDVSVLDNLQDLVGELTLARMRIGDFIDEGSPMAQTFRRLTGITRDLQDTVMRARLQPVGTVMGRLRRVVRDVATSQGKRVNLEIDGEEVGVDKAINEVLRDPLVHLVRNAVDHGIESPEERLAAGKPAVATLQIRASLIGGGVHIDVTDDGRGVDVEAVVARAVAAGRLSDVEASELSDHERMSLLFLPGVSTAAQVTTVSGRGVGMDVVQAKLEQVGGSIEIVSKPGVGTSFRINVPLTLAILPAIIVRCGAGRFTIPQADVAAVVRVGPDDIGDRTRSIGDAQFLRYQGELLPLVDLRAYLGVDPAVGDGGLEIVVVRRLERTHGLIVDAVGDSVEAVVKPLPRSIRGVGCYVGATVLADGHASPILDAAAPAIAAEVRTHVDETAAAQAEEESVSEGAMVLTAIVGEDHLAIDLDRVVRLERLHGRDVEHSGTTEVIQYRGGILPLVRMDEFLALGAMGSRLDERDDFATVVCRTSEGDVGVVVDAIGDIDPAPTGDPEPVGIPGTIGRTVVAGRVSLLVDVEQFARRRLSPAGWGGLDG